MKTLWECFQAMPTVLRQALNLEEGTLEDPYYCYPTNARAIGFEGCILYCFIEGYEDMVFASNPENYGEDGQVYPLAAHFEDFLRLVLACGSVNPVEQIVWMSREQFEAAVKEVRQEQSAEGIAAIQMLAERTGLSPMENPYDYVKAIQKDFDGSRIAYSDEYYDVSGLERPNGTGAESDLEEGSCVF